MRPSRCLKLSFAALVLGIAALIALGRAVKADDDFAAAPSTIRDGQSGILLLQDGGVLTGQITRAADWYVVGRAGGQLQIAAARVLFVGSSLHEAYEYRRRNSNRDSASSHLALAEWCLRYNLVDEAGAELVAARDSEPDNPKLALLNRRLVAARERPNQSPSPATPANSPPAAAGQSDPSRVTPDLPSGVVELFTRKVQPVLVNNCTASKCHQPGGSQAFQLNRGWLRGEANRRNTMQNLSATLALVDREHPETSPLLTVPRQTHGGMNGPVFGARQEQAFKHLADWVALVAPTKPAEEPALNPAEQQHAPVSSQPIAEAAPIADPAVQPAAAIEEPPFESLRPPHRLKYGVAGQKWQPRDAFDPEIFNRRQRATPQPQPPKANSAAPAAAVE
jgi:hypothetical protein